MNISLSKFCKDRNLPKTSVYRRCQELHIDMSNGLDEGTVSILEQEFDCVPATSNTPALQSFVSVEVGNHSMILATPQLPQTYSLESLRVSESVQIEDPIAVAQQFLQVADSLVNSMQTDIQQRESRLQQTRQAKEAIAAKSNELKLEARLYRERASMLDSALSSETQNLQDALATIQQLGKPQTAATV